MVSLLYSLILLGWVVLFFPIYVHTVASTMIVVIPVGIVVLIGGNKERFQKLETGFRYALRYYFDVISRIYKGIMDGEAQGHIGFHIIYVYAFNFLIFLFCIGSVYETDWPNGVAMFFVAVHLTVSVIALVESQVEYP